MGNFCRSSMITATRSFLRAECIGSQQVVQHQPVAEDTLQAHSRARSVRWHSGMEIRRGHVCRSCIDGRVDGCGQTQPQDVQENRTVCSIVKEFKCHRRLLFQHGVSVNRRGKTANTLFRFQVKAAEQTNVFPAPNHLKKKAVTSHRTPNVC